MTNNIVRLRPTETVKFDHDTLAALCASEGQHAETTITNALEEVGTLISVIGTQGGYYEGLHRSCTQLRRVADRVGMTTIHDGAEAVLNCIAQGNRVALAACTARLVRLGEPKQVGDWTMQQTPDTVA
ncbi:hypothetical protein SAMN05444004_10168 [Jannaschia faecimaris]|uniref:Uncharacterized protein n=1 Tax=Jannaschia faecimaris TaxID=1244108 RepID=A0A1H3IP95_9RHOB|nr:hypothetical protein [Jannaschia faecimaris]SDY29522.1 hypothetical protein SAMN05444004_10168 [Jannaschia faecimaris]